MALDTYRRKRRFSTTPEPPGESSSGGRGPAAGERGAFVVQQHDATRLHYDLRLELDGVLLSWAVPKGPSLDPAARRLAVRVEDHPLEYGSFEGTIPEDEYGAGPVLLWDRGSWRPLKDPRDGLDHGHLEFELEGEKLSGRWDLVRMEGDSARDTKENWLLIKKKDRHARPGDGDGVLSERPESVVSGRTLEGVAAGEAPDPSELPGARRAPLPERRTWEPQLATRVEAPPAGRGWLHEVKFDGYRVFCHVDGDGTTLWTRGGRDWTDRFSAVAEAAGSLPCREALLDGEVVALNERGISDFQTLQNLAGGSGAARPLFYYAFDLLYLDGCDLTGVPLQRRKETLRQLVGGRGRSASDVLRYSDHLEGSGRAFFEEACRVGLEGVVSKRADAHYTSGRSRAWRKTKCLLRQEFVVVGFTDPSGSRRGFGALLLGVHTESGELVTAGRVGTGFSDEVLLELRDRLEELERDTPPVVDPPTRRLSRDVHWVDPALVVDVAFGEWTEEGRLRHPSFQGLREDRDPADVVREEPARAPGGRVRKGKARAPREPGHPTRTRARSRGAKGGSGSGDSGPVAGVRLTHPDRVLFPDVGLTKRQLARYYERVADLALPHLADRPLTLLRCPEGREGDCFYQKHGGQSVPDRVPRVEIEEEDGTELYLAVDGLPALITLVQLGTLEFHVWGARIDRLDRPDLLVMDLDPGPGVEWTRVVDAALSLRDRLDELGLVPFARSTGGAGLHVVAPLVRRSDWAEVKGFARALANELARSDRTGFTTSPSKSRRKGRIFVDYLRNDPGATAIATYSTRGRPGAPVALPLAWPELEDSSSDEPLRWSVTEVPDRLAELDADPWDGFEDARRTLTKAMREAVGAET